MNLFFLKKHKKKLVALGALSLILLGAYALYMKKARSLRARWDCWLDVSNHLAQALNDEYEAEGVYPKPYGSQFVFASDLVAAGLDAERSFSRTVHEAGRKIRFEGDFVDPFRSEPVAMDETPGSCRYYHSASAEAGVSFTGYEIQYYCSQSGDWALLLSNAPDRDVDLRYQILLDLDDKPRSAEELLSELSPYAFNYAESLEKFSRDDRRGAFSSGDFILLLHEGRSLRIRKKPSSRNGPESIK